MLGTQLKVYFTVFIQFSGVTVHIPPANMPSVSPGVSGLASTMSGLAATVSGSAGTVSSSAATVSGSTPAVSGLAPAVSGLAPAVPGLAPAVVGIAHAVPGLAPAVVGITHAVPGLAPSVPSLAPSVPSLANTVPGLAPAHTVPGLNFTRSGLAHTVPDVPLSSLTGLAPTPAVYATKSVPPTVLPPAAVDFVSKVWNNFEETVMPFLGGVAKEAVKTNRDPLDIGDYDSVKIQTEILEGTYSKYQCFKFSWR